MFKNCNCGQMMRLELRSLIYAHKLCIKHVPVYACQVCSSYDLIPLVKPDLVFYIRSLGEIKRRQQVSFADIYEPASVMREALSLSMDYPFEFQKQCKIAFGDRTNMLLDLYSVANTKGDSVWMEEITNRLEKMTAFVELHKEYLEYCMN